MTTAQIRLGKTGKVAVIDAADLPLTEGWRFYYWNPKLHLGPARVIAKKFLNGTVKQTWLNRLISGVEDSKIKVTHHNGDGLDCRRSNLKEATQTTTA